MGKKDSAKKGTASKIPGDVYEAELFRLQSEFVKLQEWVKDTGTRVVVIFEGRDAAGVARTHEPRARPVVLPAIHRPPAGARRDHHLRPILVQPGRR